jgi:hypothetical protein
MTTTKNTSTEIAEKVARTTAEAAANIVVDGIERGDHVSQIRWNVNRFVEAVEAEFPTIAATFQIREAVITAAERTIRIIETAVEEATR